MKLKNFPMMLALTLLLSGCTPAQPETEPVLPPAVTASPVSELDWLAQAAADGLFLAADPEQEQYLQAVPGPDGEAVLRLWRDRAYRDLCTGNPLAAGWTKDGSILICSAGEPPVLTCLSPELEPIKTPLSDTGTVLGARVQDGQLCLWEREHIRWYNPDGQLQRNLHLTGYTVDFVQAEADAPLLISARQEGEPLFLTAGPPDTPIRETPYPRDWRVYNACQTEAGIYVAAGKSMDNPEADPKELVFFPADGGARQSRELTGQPMLYAGTSGMLLRYSYSHTERGKLFVIDPRALDLIEVDTGDLGLLHNNLQILPTETGFLVLAEWITPEQDLIRAALEITVKPS